MKKYKFFTIACILVVFSCQDAIDIDQAGRLTEENAFNNIDDLERGLLGVYTTFNPKDAIEFNSTFTDEVAVGVATGSQNFTTGFIFNLNAASGIATTLWLQHYGSLNEINRLLAAAEGVVPDDVDQARYDNVLGQALALRAYAHFTLLSYYSTDYTNDGALAVPLSLRVPSIADQPLRNTNGEVFQSIADDLAEADSLLSDAVSPTGDTVSNDFVLALRARIAAYREDYTTASSIAQDLLTRHPLASRDTFQDIWLDLSNDEVIFEFARVFNGPFDFQLGWLGRNYAFVNATAGGGAFLEFSRSLFNLIDPNDIRFDAYVAPSSTISPDYLNAMDQVNEDILVIQKYPGHDGQLLMNDVKVFRSAEMLLIQAEAFADSGQLNGATSSVAAILKELRDARFELPQPLPIFGTATDAWNEILNERRVELAFEGHRWLDIKRLGAKANQNILRDPLDCAQFANGCELVNSDFRLTMPLPLQEFNGNPGLRDQQNPGYAAQ